LFDVPAQYSAATGKPDDSTIDRPLCRTAISAHNVLDNLIYREILMIAVFIIPDVVPTSLS
jgi:hypothetical protein